MNVIFWFIMIILLFIYLASQRPNVDAVQQVHCHICASPWEHRAKTKPRCPAEPKSKTLLDCSTSGETWIWKISAIFAVKILAEPKAGLSLFQRIETQLSRSIEDSSFSQSVFSTAENKQVNIFKSYFDWFNPFIYSCFVYILNKTTF